MDKKPGLAILIGHALAKKGKAQHDPMPEASDEDAADGGVDDNHEHLKEVAGDLLKAFEDKDVDAIADLLHEAFMVCGASHESSEEE